MDNHDVVTTISVLCYRPAAENVGIVRMRGYR